MSALMGLLAMMCHCMFLRRRMLEWLVMLSAGGPDVFVLTFEALDIPHQPPPHELFDITSKWTYGVIRFVAVSNGS